MWSVYKSLRSGWRKCLSGTCWNIRGPSSQGVRIAGGRCYCTSNRFCITAGSQDVQRGRSSMGCACTWPAHTKDALGSIAQQQNQKNGKEPTRGVGVLKDKVHNPLAIRHRQAILKHEAVGNRVRVLPPVHRHLELDLVLDLHIEEKVPLLPVMPLQTVSIIMSEQRPCKRRGWVTRDLLARSRAS